MQLYTFDTFSNYRYVAYYGYMYIQDKLIPKQVATNSYMQAKYYAAIIKLTA